MKNYVQTLGRRYEALRLRIEALSSVRSLVSLPSAWDISSRQWSVIESQLGVTTSRLLARLKDAGRTYLPQAYDLAAARRMNAVLGEIELDLAQAFVFFDTYADILTQRQAPDLGRLLAGCDVLASDGIKRDHPALTIIEPPLVYCERGFGAATMREGVLLPDRSPNPMPIIQIPYSRLKEKYNLTSVLHEIGHEAMVRLGLVTSLPKALRYALGQAGASVGVQSFYGLWAFEMGPDFWTFCATGVAAAGGIREILALPPSHAFRVIWTDPHPPPYLRALVNFECCRQTWGSGPWDAWEAEWTDLYTLGDAPQSTRGLIKEARSFVPTVTRALLTTRYRVLNGRTIRDLFDLPALAPARLSTYVAGAEAGLVDFPGLSPAAQLGIYRLVKERGVLNEEKLDATMTNWLLKLGGGSRVPPREAKETHGRS